jgi:hypothetical protein
MTLGGKHEVVGHADRDCLWEDDLVVEQGIESVKTADVEVEVNAAVMKEDEIADGVGALDGPLVAVKRAEEPRVMLLDEVTRRLVCPEDVLAARRGVQRGLNG